MAHNSKIIMNESAIKTLITGGCRSGKSQYGLTRFEQTHGRKLFLATAEAGDEEMTDRIRMHRQQRDPSWTTLEEPEDLAATITAEAPTASAILLDCLTLWISNLMMRQVPFEDILQRAEHLAITIKQAPCPVAVITNEVGFGIVPDNELGREFRDLAGLINQQFADVFDEVILMVSGIAMKVKDPQAGPAVPADPEAPFSFPRTEKKGVYEAIYLRRDMRHFLPDAVAPEVVGRILHAAHHAGSVGFMQPWNFMVIDDPVIKQRVADNFKKANAAAAQNYAGSKKDLYNSLKLEGILDAPLNLCITCDPTRSGPHILGRDTIPETDLFSTCCAVQNLWLAARAEGLGVGWVSILEPELLRRDLEIPDHVVPVAYLCIGHCEEFYREPMLQSSGWARRLPLQNLVFYNQWRGIPGDFQIVVPPDSPLKH